jgi:hypothetical protein
LPLKTDFAMAIIQYPIWVPSGAGLGGVSRLTRNRRAVEGVASTIYYSGLGSMPASGCHKAGAHQWTVTTGGSQERRNTLQLIIRSLNGPLRTSVSGCKSNRTHGAASPVWTYEVGLVDHLTASRPYAYAARTYSGQ